MIAKVHLTVTLQRRVAQQNANCTIFYGGVLRTSSRLSQPYENKLLSTLVIRHWILTTVASKLSRWLPMMFWPVLFLWLLLISLFKHDFFCGCTGCSSAVFLRKYCSFSGSVCQPQVWPNQTGLKLLFKSVGIFLFMPSSQVLLTFMVQTLCKSSCLHWFLYKHIENTLFMQLSIA